MLKDYSSYKPKILFIASNIPTPKRNSNRVVVTIAQKLTGYFDISLLHPAEYTPFPVSLLKKYRNVADKKRWESGELEIIPFKYLRLPTLPLSFLALPLFKRKFIKTVNKIGKYNLAHAHFILPDGYLALILKRSHDIPYVISIRATDVNYLQRLDNRQYIYRLYMEVIGNASKLYVHNKNHHEYMESIGFRSTLIAHGIDPDFFDDRYLEPHLEEVLISTIGGFIHRKNINWIINALREYRGNKKVALSIAGDGLLKEELERASKGLDVTFLGQIPADKVKRLLSGSSIFALPSVEETFGLVYLEAAARKNGVIAMKDTGVWGHFDPGKEILFCDSYESFKDNLHNLIDNDSLRNTLANNAYLRTKNNYKWDTIIEIYRENYLEILRNYGILSK